MIKFKRTAADPGVQEYSGEYQEAMRQAGAGADQGAMRQAGAGADQVVRSYQQYHNGQS